MHEVAPGGAESSQVAKLAGELLPYESGDGVLATLVMSLNNTLSMSCHI